MAEGGVREETVATLTPCPLSRVVRERGRGPTRVLALYCIARPVAPLPLSGRGVAEGRGEGGEGVPKAG